MIRGEIGLLKEVIEAIVHTIEVDSITISTVYSTVNTCNTLYLNTGTELTIDGTKYRITEFVLNESFTLKAVRGTTTLDTSITEITIPNPRFYDGTPRRAQAEALNDQKVPGYQTPIIWALTWVEIKGPEDKRTSYIRSTIEGLNLFFLDFCKHEDWNQQDHRTEVWEPMENEMWHIFRALELRTDIFSRDIQEPDRRFHSNFGTYLTNKGYDNTILTGAWSGVQAILDIPYIIDPCDCETVVVCRPARFLIEGVTEETILAGGDLNITIEDQDGNPVDYSYDADTNILEVQTTSGGSIDIYVNGVPFYVGVSTNQDLPVLDSTAVTPVGSKIGVNFIIGDAEIIIKNTADDILVTSNVYAESQNNEFVVGDSPATFNSVPVTPIPSEQGKDIAAYDSAFNNIGTVLSDTTTVLDISIADSVVSNSDDTYTANVLAEGTLELPDVTMTQPNGDTLSYPSVKNFSCTLISALANADLISDITDAQLVALYNGRITINVIELTTLGAQDYTKPANLLYADVICVGAGGGGSSGQRRAAPTASQGGGGGGAGAIARRRILASAMASTEVVTVGAGGAGGAAQTADDGLQLGGTAGGSTSFGTLVVAVGGFGGTNGSNAAGTITVRTANTPNTSQLNIQGGVAGAGGTTAGGTTGNVMTTSSTGLHYGGGGGGALSAATPGVENVGGAGSRIYDSSGVLSAVNAGGTASGGNGNNGNNNVALQVQLYESILHTIGLGSSGSGGGSENAGVAGYGGNGGLYGAGGGGGGGSRNGNNSGYGGDGAQGCVIIYEFLV